MGTWDSGQYNLGQAMAKKGLWGGGVKMKAQVRLPAPHPIDSVDMTPPTPHGPHNGSKEDRENGPDGHCVRPLVGYGDHTA